MTERANLSPVAAGGPESYPIVGLAEANKHAMNFLFEAQRVFLDNLSFVNSEMLTRYTTEAHLLAEYLSKLAGSHSVKDLRTMCQECGQHQLDFIRRDSERIFKQGERLMETTLKLVDMRPRL